MSCSPEDHPRSYDGVLIDPRQIDFDGREGVEFPSSFYAICCKAGYTFALGHWRARWRAAEARNDFDELDRLDALYEWIGV